MKRPRWQALVAATLAIAVIYWAVGAGVGARLARGQLHALLAGSSGQTLALDRLSFNPFTLTASFEGLRLEDDEDLPVLTVAAGRLRLAFAGLFGNALAISDLALDRPGLVVALSGPAGKRRLRTAGRLLVAAGDGGEAAPVRIARATISEGRIFFAIKTGERARQAPLATLISDVTLELSDFMSGATTPAPFDLAARVNDVAMMRARGGWLPASRSVEADVELVGLALAPFAPLFEAWLDDGRLAGVLSARGRLRRHADSHGFEGDVGVDQLRADDAGGRSVLSADSLTATGVKIAGRQLVATAQHVELDGPQVGLHPGAGGLFNLRRLIVDTLPRIDKTTVRNGRVSFTDARPSSTVQIDAHAIVGEIVRPIDGLRETLKMSLAGEFAGQGTVAIDGLMRTDDGRLHAEGDATLSGVDAAILSAYLSRLAGRDIDAGLLDLQSHYHVEGVALAISNKVLLENFALGPPGADSPASDLPLDLSVALLTDEAHRMAFELPVEVAATDSGDAWRQGFEGALTKFMDAVTANPTLTIERLVGAGADKLSPVIFAAGSTDILPAADQQLATWLDVLARRPLLGLRARGRFAAHADRVALARRQIGLHIALAASTRADDSSAAAELDFSDPKVQAVLDEFAAARLNAAERNMLRADATEMGDGTATIAKGAYYPAVFEALAAKESVSDYALRQLARYRAHALVGRLLELGVGKQRLEVDKSVAAVDANDLPASVALTFTAY